VKGLDRRLEDEAKLAPFPPLDMANFKIRLSCMRDGVYRFGGQRIKELFVTKLLDKYDEPSQLRVFGKKIDSITGFCEFIKQGPWDDTMRSIVHYAQDGMWDSGNKWTQPLERELTDMLAIRWTGKRAYDVDHPKGRNTDGNCFKHLFVRKKAALVGRIRDTTRRVWYEGIYARQPSTKETKGDPKIPRVADFIKVCHAVSGFSGYIGYCVGHKQLDPPMVAFADSPSGSNASDLTTNSNDVTLPPELFPHKSRKKPEADDDTQGSKRTMSTSTTSGCERDSAATARILHLENILREAEKKGFRSKYRGERSVCVACV
jgi:hypothetical protein